MKDPGKLKMQSDKQDFQMWLRKNNISDNSGNLLIADGVFGRKTGEAVRKFQKRI